MPSVSRAGATSVATLCGLALTVGMAYLAAPQWIKAVGLDVWHVIALRNEIEIESKAGLDLGVEIEQSKCRLMLKYQLIDNLWAGQTTLKDVTTQFLSLNQSERGCMLMIRSNYKGATDEEKTARNVLDFVTQRKCGSSAQDAEMLAQLVIEFRQLTGNPAAKL